MTFKSAFTCLILFSNLFDSSICNGIGLKQISRSRRDAFKPPHVTLEALRPKGFRASIPDGEGIQLFAFHGNLNKPLEHPEAGEFSVDIVDTENGRWTYTNSKVKLNVGDVINFWAFVEHGEKGKRRLGYIIEDQTFNVTEFVDKNGETHTASSLPTSSAPTTEAPCRQSESKISHSSEIICERSLLFEDTFAVNSQINPQWTNEVKFPDHPDKPFVFYSNDNAYVNDGKLFIKPQILEEKYGKDFEKSSLNLGEKCTVSANDTGECQATGFGDSIISPIISAKLQTRNSFNFKYGRVEVIAKLPKGDWIYPEILLEPKDNVYGADNYSSGIIRIAFTKGNSEQSKLLQSGMIMGVQPTLRHYGIQEKHNSKSWSDDYHNYTLVWKPDNMSMFVDGEQYGSITPGYGEFSTARRKHNESGNAPLWRGSNMAPFDEMFYISLSVAVGGKSEFPDKIGKPWINTSPNAVQDFWDAKDTWFPTWSQESSSLQVDSVRVYAL